METERHHSKGMRKHTRKVKALKRKEDSLKECVPKQPPLIDYEKVPMTDSSWTCPLCGKSYVHSSTREFNTRQGKKKVQVCNNCHLHYRLKY